MNAAESSSVLFCACGGFAVIAGLTFFFSFHRKLLIRVFVPREEWRKTSRSLLKEPDFGRSFRIIAALQFIVALIFGAVALWSVRR